MKKNYILAFALSFAVLMGWQYFVGKTQKPVAPEVAASATPALSPSGPRPVEPPSSTFPLRRESAVVFELGNNRVSLNRYGGGVAQWEIKEGAQWLTLSPEKEFSVQSLSTFPDVLYDVRQEGNRLILSGRRADGLKIIKTIDVSPAGPLHRVSVGLTNTGKTPLAASYDLGWGPGVEAGDESGKDGREAKGFQRALVFEASKLTKLKPGTYSGSYDWWGVDGHYFLGAFVHQPGEKMSEATLRVEKEDHYFSVRRAVSVPLNPGESREDSFSFYLGPKGY